MPYELTHARTSNSSPLGWFAKFRIFFPNSIVGSLRTKILIAFVGLTLESAQLAKGQITQSARLVDSRSTIEPDGQLTAQSSAEGLHPRPPFTNVNHSHNLRFGTGTGPVNRLIGFIKVGNPWPDWSRSGLLGPRANIGIPGGATGQVNVVAKAGTAEAQDVYMLPTPFNPWNSNQIGNDGHDNINGLGAMGNEVLLRPRVSYRNIPAVLTATQLRVSLLAPGGGIAVDLTGAPMTIAVGIGSPEAGYERVEFANNTTAANMTIINGVPYWKYRVELIIPAAGGAPEEIITSQLITQTP